MMQGLTEAVGVPVVLKGVFGYKAFKQAQCSSNTSNNIVMQTAKWSDLIGLDLTQIKTPPSIGEITSYQTVDITQEPNSSLVTLGELSLPASSSNVSAPLSLVAP